ncbi:S41 family peptidase [Gilvibacter sediminis]|uniref:S41 family peptidase n=1 Tax=Gilvibacter sediminis TaxID=379071 RepID=UPI00235096EF|nr:S41 family peptidase [Gilvibacter sediminis]MDC7998383.1 S41 family peptidase [Gilvibacter sediminis]
MKTTLTFILLFLFQLGFSQKEFKTEKLLIDFDFAVEQLHLLHQGFYNYEQKDIVDAKIEKLKNEIDSPMTKLEFYEIMRKLLGIMNEGHGSVDLPTWTMVKTGLSKSFFPLSVQFFDSKLVVTQNYGDNTKGLLQGDRIISINGKSIEDVINRLLPLIPTDGFNETSSYEWLGGVNLSLLYRLVYGKQETFNLEVIEYGTEKVKSFQLPAVKFTKFKSKNGKFNFKQFEYESFVYRRINDSVGYLSIPDFYSRSDFPFFYKESFKKIKEQNIKHLILDIQDNVGGIEGNENLLFHYLTPTVIKKYKEVTMLRAAYLKNKNDKDYIFDKWQLKDTIAYRGEFTCYSDYFSDLGYQKPNEDYIYNGKLYILTSGVTFSGGAEFASMIKMTNRGVFIGEETGGAYEGNVSGYSEDVKLPKTKIKFDIPTVHFKIDVNPKEIGRGIIPDYKVPQTWEDYMTNKNTKLEFTLNLITNSNESN